MKKYTLGETRFINMFSESFNTNTKNHLLSLKILSQNSEGEPRFLIETRRIILSNRKYEIDFVADFYNNLDEVVMDEYNMFPCYSHIIIEPETINSNFNIKDKKGFLRSLNYVTVLKTFQDILLKHFAIHYKNILIEAVGLLHETSNI